MMSKFKLKNKFIILLALLVLSLFTFSGCAKDTEPAPKDKEAAPVEVFISAAASLTDALTEIQGLYSKESKDTLVFNFAGSGALVKQVQEGAPCDMFVSASKSDMDTLEEAKLIDSKTRTDLLGNTLTLVASAEAKDMVKGKGSFTDEQVKTIAIGTPESVPAGKYAKQVFEGMGIWDQVQPKLILGKDVKQILEYVETGNVDCGLVYKSDAMLMKTGVVIEDMPADDHDSIVYPAAVLTEATQPDAAKAFCNYIQTAEVKTVFEKYGFQVI